jgi:hypothetical protein
MPAALREATDHVPFLRISFDRRPASVQSIFIIEK